MQLFDLASLTKPFTAVAVALHDGLLDQPLGRALPLAAGSPAAAQPLAHLLGHCAGFDAHVPLFLPAVSGERVEKEAALVRASRALRTEAKQAPERSHAVYSDLGYALAGEALARAAGTVDAGRAIEGSLLETLGLSDAIGCAATLRARLRDAEARFVPTEPMAWRGGVSRGAVHDDNAWVLTGEGASGHAGLFGTVGGVLGFGRAVVDGWVEGAGPLAPVPWGRMLAAHAGTTWRMGFDGKSPGRGSTAGERASSASIGHLGFTGTSVWVDPERKAVTVLLTNRVHPSREFNALRELRAAVHDALFALAENA
jgi:CubicO group peptidase (beta-lactamase class C family)